MTEVRIDEIGGNCPVQAQGTIDGKRFYFRARGAAWSLEVHPTARGEYMSWTPMTAVWSYSEPYGVWPDAGWMEEAEARAFIEKAAGIYGGQRASGFWSRVRATLVGTLGKLRDF